MEPEGSLPHSQVPATCPYTEPARSSSDKNTRKKIKQIKTGCEDKENIYFTRHRVIIRKGPHYSRTTARETYLDLTEM
jgi:hypothetical protein